MLGNIHEESKPTIKAMMKLPINHDDGRAQRLQQAVEKINDALNDMAYVVGLDVLQQVVENE